MATPNGDLDIVARTSVVGAINGEPYEGDVRAQFNTSRGGTSQCTFARLPEAFNPGTIGTHT